MRRNKERLSYTTKYKLAYE